MQVTKLSSSPISQTLTSKKKKNNKKQTNSIFEALDGIERITGKRPTFVQADCTDMEALHQLFKENPGIKGIIHFAASKAVGESVQKPLLYYRNNLMSLVNLLTLMP